MKKPFLRLTALVFALSVCPAHATTLAGKNDSLKQEIELSVNRALAFLKDKQDKGNGSWSLASEPGITGLVLGAFAAKPGRKPGDALPPEADHGYHFLLENVKPDGGIYSTERANYNTAIALTALALNPKPEYTQTIINARKFVYTQQNDFDAKGVADNAFDGGIGYGTPKENTPAHADMSNTHFALEALDYSKKIFAKKAAKADKKTDLDWPAVLKFVDRCQNRPASNDQKWASDDAKNFGGFIYEPGISKAGEDILPGGRVALRSYGSITCAGILNYFYAGVKPGDPRVQDALKWLGENYTLTENPGMEQEGRFYYYLTLAKALSVGKINVLTAKDGKAIDWRGELSRRLLNDQRPDGSWLNETGRWMESDPVLVTAYTVIALEHIYRGL